MSHSDWNAGIIRPVPVAPTGPYENGVAPGVWTLDQMAYWLKQGLWPIAGNTAPAYALWAGGMTSNAAYIIYANLNSASNFALWGNLTYSPASGGVGLSSTTRGVFCGGTPAGNPAVMCYVTLATTGNATSFGTIPNTQGTYNGVAGVSNTTRGVIMGGAALAVSDRVRSMSYITTATLGNATYFGDLTQNLDNINQGGSSGTRGVIAGGYGSSTATSSRIEYITIATTGNSTTFGNLTSARFIPAGMSSNTRAVWAGGSSTSVIDYVTIATTGNATSFGTLTFNAGDASGLNNGVRGAIARSGGSTADYITIATTGNGTNFGNLTYSTQGGMLMACCSAQGGLV